MLFRSWLTFTIVIAVVQGVLALLAVLQHDAILSELLRQRIAVIAQTTAAPYRPILSLGLPISMLRNGDAIVARALEMDREITAVHTFNPSGVIVHSTQDPHPQSVAPALVRLMQFATGPVWGTETDAEIVSGRNLFASGSDAIGAIVVTYPTDRLVAASRSIVDETLKTAILIWVGFSAVAYFLLRTVLAAPRRVIASLETISPSETGGQEGAAEAVSAGHRDVDRGMLGSEVLRLKDNLGQAARRHDEALRTLGGRAGTDDNAKPAGTTGDNADTPAEAGRAADPSRSLARALAMRLAPPAAAVIAISALILGVVILQQVNRSIEPELAARTNLVGVIVSENVQRAVAAGAPLDKLVGAENYFGDMLTQLPEVAYVAVATGRIVLEAGERIDPYLAPPRQRKDVRSHPIMLGGEEIAYVVIDIDPAFIAKRFRDVFLDMSVVILVTILIAFEIMILLTSRTLTAGLDRLQRLAAMQAAGDFSRTASGEIGGAIGGLTRMLSSRAESLHEVAAHSVSTFGDAGRSNLERARARYGLSGGQPEPLRMTYFTDIRLALFLFAAADELPLAFLPIYTRAADNIWPWLNQSVLISLPLAGYLLAIVCVSPFARALTQRFGVRTLFLAAGLPMIGAYLGLYVAETAQEIVLWRTMTGIGYAIVTLACQDYVLDTAPPRQRDRTLGVFTLVLFGGVFAGVALGGVLADRLGQRNVFLLSATLIAVSAGLSAWLIAPGAARDLGSSERFSLSKIVAPLRNVQFAAIALGASIPSGVVMQAFVSYLVALTLDSIGASTADIGRALMLFFIGIIAVGPLGGRLAEAGIPVRLLALAGAVLSGVALASFVLWPITAVLIVALALSGIGFGLVRGAQVSLVMTIAETELARLGTVAVLGSLRTLERIGSVLGLLLVASVAGAAGYTAAIGTIAIWTLAGAVFFAASLLPRGRAT